MKVMIAGGGTGGHVFPGIAVAEELRRSHPEAEVVFVGSRRGLEAAAVPEAGFRMRVILARGFPRRAWWRWPIGAIVEPDRAVPGVRAWWRASGPTSCSAPAATSAPRSRSPPGCSAGRCCCRSRTASPGLANRWLARIADEVHLSFVEAALVLHPQGPPQGERQPDPRPHPERRSLDRDGGVRRSRPASRRSSCSAAAAVRTASTRRRSRRCSRLKGRVDVQWILQTGREDFDVGHADRREGAAAGARAAVPAPHPPWPTPSPTSWCAAPAP